MSDSERCDPTVTSCVTSAALSSSDSESTRNVTPRPTAAAAVIRASCPPPTMPTTGIPVPDFRAMGPAGPAGDNGESTPVAYAEPPNPGYNKRGDTRQQRRILPPDPTRSPPRPRQPGEPK